MRAKEELEKLLWQCHLKRTHKWPPEFIDIIKEYETQFGYIDFENWQRIFKFKEYEQGIKAAAWKMLDLGNPAHRPVDFSEVGKNMQSDFKIKVGEPVEVYWNRVRLEISKKLALK